MVAERGRADCVIALAPPKAQLTGLCAQTALFWALSRRARTRRTLSAKWGVCFTRKIYCFSEIGATIASVLAIASALRGAEFDQRHLSEDLVFVKRFEEAVARTDFHLAPPNDEEFLGLVSFAEDDLSRREEARRDVGAEQKAEVAGIAHRIGSGLAPALSPRPVKGIKAMAVADNRNERRGPRLRASADRYHRPAADLALEDPAARLEHLVEWDRMGDGGELAAIEFDR